MAFRVHPCLMSFRPRGARKIQYGFFQQHFSRKHWCWILIFPFVCNAVQGQTQSIPTATLLTLDQAVNEALEQNLGLLAERYNISIADARIITARLRPNPILSIGGDHLDVLGTGYNTENAAGPAEYSVRTDFVFERGRE